MEWTCDVCRTYHWRETEGNIYYLDKDDWQLEETKYLCKTCAATDTSAFRFY